MVFRICVSGTSSYAPAGAGDGTRDTGNGATSAWTPAGTGATAARSRSRLITRPPGPDPWRSFRSPPVSFAMRFASGDARTRPASTGAATKAGAVATFPVSRFSFPAVAGGGGGGRRAVRPRDQLHHGLIGLYLGQSVARFHRVALLLQPLDQPSLLHRGGERLHIDH